MKASKDWFVKWFDTPYYHMLYKHRDQTEAHGFIDRLFDQLQPEKDQKILDLACGRGRHAIYMNQKGYEVVGLDLAPENIEFAKQYENERLHFAVKDMREDLGTTEFDWVFNLFTSFGYFDQPDEDLKAMKAIHKGLRPKGKLVLDFMNVHRVARRLVPEEVKQVNDITFQIERSILDGHIVKDIRFHAENMNYHYEEKVKALTKSDFESLFSKVGLVTIAAFGSLDLQPFDEEKSDRLILVAEKQ